VRDMLSKRSKTNHITRCFIVMSMLFIAGWKAAAQEVSQYDHGTPPVFYTYDAQALPGDAPIFDRGSATGRLVAVTYGSNSSAGSYYGYDSLGRTSHCSISSLIA
jgi:hypothetical protein